jgi:hypothetical protein
MASFARSALPQREWTAEEHALFAARKEFEGLSCSIRLLSTLDRQTPEGLLDVALASCAVQVTRTRNRKLQLMPILELLGRHRSHQMR